MRLPIPSRRRRAATSLVVASAALFALLARVAAHAQAVEAPGAAAVEAVGPIVLPVPDGTPAELLNFIEALREPPAQPLSPEQMAAYPNAVAIASVRAADKILAQVQPADEAAVTAAKVKLENLARLGRSGDEQAAQDFAAYATTLAAGANAELAKEAKLMLLIAEARAFFASGDPLAAPALTQKVVDLVAADPDDKRTAGLATQFAGLLESMPDGEPLAAKAYEAIQPLFAKSTNPQIQKLGERFAGALRRLSLVGKPMKLEGTLLAGAPFDPASLAGKVVLVDFWATWCGPCVEEIPGVKQAYAKYHDAGFEVVGISLDEERAAVDRFVKDEGIPWPILFDEPGGFEGNPMAREYGIRGIPTMILIGRDGNVITLDARGEKLAEKLEKLFKDAG